MLQSLANFLLVGLGGLALGFQAVVWYSFFFQTPRDVNHDGKLLAANHASHAGSFIFLLAAIVEILSHAETITWRHPAFGAAIIAELASSYFATHVMHERRKVIDTAEARLRNLQKHLEVIKRKEAS